MAEEVQRCENCKRGVNTQNYMIHSLHCERNIQFCYRCSEPVPLGDLQKHEEAAHSKEVCPDCGISMEKWQSEKHKEICVKKLIPCEYCELEVPLDRLLEHSSVCGSRTEHCSKCNKHVMLKNLENHPMHCLKKVQEDLPCEYCGLKISCSELMEHTVLCGTRTERCILCNEHVMLQDRDTHLVNCEKESISCDHCGLFFNHNGIERHVEFCRLQTEKCNFCNCRIPKKDMGSHLTMCEQSTQMRLKIPCNYCGELFPSHLLEEHANRCRSQTQKCETCDKFVLLKNMEAHSSVCIEKKQLRLNIPCTHCGELFSRDYLKLHALTCRSRTQKCGKCEKFIPLINMKAHSSICGEKEQFKLEIPCNYCGVLFPMDFLEDHANRCRSQSQKCTNCDQLFPLEDMKAHSSVCKEKKDFKRSLPCKFCGELFPSELSEDHTKECGYQPQKCEKCGNKFPSKHIKAHSSVCREKKELRRNYPDNYHKEEFPRDFLQDRANNCASQTRISEKSDKDISLRNREAHSNECEEKKQLNSSCKYCGDKILSDYLADHTNKCGYRTQKCKNCEKLIQLKDMEEHFNDCQDTISKTHGNCPICHQPVPWIEMNVHCAYCSQVYYGTPEHNHQNQFNELALRKDSEEKVLSSKSIEKKKSLFSKDTKICPFCTQAYPCDDFDQHIKLCEDRRFKCVMCLKAMPYYEKEDHVLNCQRQLPGSHKDDLMHHGEEKKDEELKKLKKCQFCDKKFTDVVFLHHMKECGHREEKCGVCSKSVLVKDMQQHRLYKCNYAQHSENLDLNYVNCMGAEALPQPTPNFETPEYLEVIVEVCPSCSCKIPEERYHNHLLLCYNGLIQCHFCGKELPKKSEHGHFQNCSKISAMAKGDDKSSSLKKTQKLDKKKSFSEIFFPSWWPSNKEKSYVKDTAEEVKETLYGQLDRSRTFERGFMPPVQPSTTLSNELLPCEFCDKMWPADILIEHESACRPDLVCYPKHNENDQKFATAVATAYPISHEYDLGARPKNTREEFNERREVPFRRHNEAADRENSYYRPKSNRGEINKWDDEQSNRNNPASVRENIGYRPTSTREENNDRRETQYRGYYEAPIRENIDYKTNERNVLPSQVNSKNRFIFYTPQNNEVSKNQSRFSIKNDSVLSTDVKKFHETKKNSSSLQGLTTESSLRVECSKPNASPEMKAVGAEKTERKRIIHSMKDAEADSTLVNKEFDEMFSENLIKHETEKCKYSELTETTGNLDLPVIWNTEFNSNNDKTLRNPLSKSFNNFDKKTKDDCLTDAAENVQHTALNSSLQDIDYDARYNGTSRKNILGAINYNQNKEYENDTRSISDDTFYDADDGEEKYLASEKIYGNRTRQEEMLSYHYYDSLNFGNRNQRDNMNQRGLEEEDLKFEDSDLDVYKQFLHGSKQKSDKVKENKIDELENLMRKTSFKDASNSSEFIDVEPLVAGARTSSPTKFNRRMLETSGKKKVEDETFAHRENLKLKKWRAPEVYDSN